MYEYLGLTDDRNTLAQRADGKIVAETDTGDVVLGYATNDTRKYRSDLTVSPNAPKSTRARFARLRYNRTF